MLLTKIKAGNILIAEPTLIGDVSFQRSVIMVANHDEKGSVGFIMNKPLTHTLSDIIPSIIQDYRIYNGGPVEKDNLYFIHNVPNLIPDSIEIAQGIYWGGCFDLAIDLILNEKITQENIKFFLGYSSWSKDQLEGEINLNSWIAKKTNLQSILSEPSIDYWKNEMQLLGGDYLLWMNAPEDPSYN